MARLCERGVNYFSAGVEGCPFGDMLERRPSPGSKA
jgi:hypothetical protein